MLYVYSVKEWIGIDVVKCLLKKSMCTTKQLDKPYNEHNWDS
jgi:hypothetical protein